MDAMQRIRIEAAVVGNADDAALWRWFSALLKERRIRWRWCFDNWIVNVDRTHVATESSFDRAGRRCERDREDRGIGCFMHNGEASHR
ncbi:hypothetical protein VOM14_10440 [Paraburkholderia sp. MPAMCS5]|uniref:hypothetical protein n=1 Tax=Paraburkholderia sp. MPAMCS5 TaxID=3112563 RepID=UPI002E178EB4|nr:hypothetical protein [Paraburkholderia sp. MPAMCS5]